MLNHGLIDIGGTWFFNEADISLALEMVDHGFDVWVSNNRGTVNSNKHVKYTVNDKEYWNFSFDEMGEHDLPTFVDYILEQTGHDQVIYAGHSQGTTQWFIGNIVDSSLA
jgi:pimeloyl-ACP methyl ester carboxylesterase